MKINMPCPICQAYNHTDIEEHKKINYICMNGHDIGAYLTMPIYPLFFQYGLTSYDKSYYFESFIALYKTYESFIREFVTTVLFHNRGKQISSNIRFFNNTHTNEINRFVKRKLRTSSQLHVAFQMLFFMQFEKEEPKFNQNLITSRNLFVHADKIVTAEDCQCLAVEIKKFVREVELELLSKEIILGNYPLNEWLNLTDSSREQLKPMQTQELELGMGALDPSNDFFHLLDKALEYDRK